MLSKRQISGYTYLATSKMSLLLTLLLSVLHKAAQYLPQGATEEYQYFCYRLSRARGEDSKFTFLPHLDDTACLSLNSPRNAGKKRRKIMHGDLHSNADLTDLPG